MAIEMTKEQKEAHDGLITEVKSLISEVETKSDGKISGIKSDLEKKLNDLEKKSEGFDFSAAKQEIEELSAKVKALSESPKKEAKAKSFDEAFIEEYKSKAEEIKKIVNGKQDAPLIFNLKSAVDMTTETTIGAGSTQYTLTQNTGIISVIRKRLERYLSKVSVGSLSGSRALWVEETDEQGVPIFIGEGDGKTKLSVLYLERTASVKKIAVYGKVTTEMLADLPQLISYIKNNLQKRLGIKIEDQLISGDNIGDNLNGIEEVATAFSAGDLAGDVVDANEWDVLNAIAAQVKIANGIPSSVYLHPVTVQYMKTLKSSTGEPLWKMYMDGNALNVGGLEIIETTAVTAGNFIGGDMSVANVLFREEMNIQVGLDGNDFTNNKKTILVESRLVQFVSANDVPVVVAGDFATAKAALLLV